MLVRRCQCKLCNSNRMADDLPSPPNLPCASLSFKELILKLNSWLKDASRREARPLIVDSCRVLAEVANAGARVCEQQRGRNACESSPKLVVSRFSVRHHVATCCLACDVNRWAKKGRQHAAATAWNRNNGDVAPTRRCG